MSDLNQWSVTGRCGRDAELRQTGNGDPVLNARIAVNGWKKDEVLWVGVTVFGKRAEKLANFLTKGTRCAVTGRAQLREYQTREGSPGTSLEIVANDVALLGGGERTGGGQSITGNGNTQVGGNYDSPPPSDDDDLPF